MKVFLAKPRGFCAGVERAIEIVEQALVRYGTPVYVLHEIVHNRRVVEELSSRGVRFVDDLREVPDDSVIILSAHGVAEAVELEGRRRGLRVIDATCPLVSKVHAQAQRYHKAGCELILVGHEGHPEVDGTRGRVEGKVHVLASVEEVEALEVDDPHKLAYVTQTTLSTDDTREVVDALQRRFPGISGPDLEDICYATQNRQNAVREMEGKIDVLVVVGSRNSSNSNRLRELGERAGRPAYLIDGAAQLESSWFEGASSVGLTSGASAPETLVQEVLGRLAELGFGDVHELPGDPEDVTFRLPAM